MQTARIRKINSLIKSLLGQIILKECDWTRHVILSITRVDTSPDLEQAKVYVSIFGGQQSPEEHLQRIRREAKHLRYVLAQKMEIRKIPLLKFEMDDSIQQAERVTRILDEL